MFSVTRLDTIFDQIVGQSTTTLASSVANLCDDRFADAGARGGHDSYVALQTPMSGTMLPRIFKVI